MAATCERLQVQWKRTVSGFTEDLAAITLHFRGAAGPDLDDTKRAAVEARWATLWTTWKAKVTAMWELDQYRWYDQEVWPTPSPLLRANDITNVPGTAVATQLPPQLALSVTLQTLYRKRWGRFYMPCHGTADLVTASGRVATATVDSLTTAAQTFLNGCIADGAVPVVWSRTGGVGPPAFAAGDYLPVTGVRMDDIVDVVRSRRWQSLPYRKILTVA